MKIEEMVNGKWSMVNEEKMEEQKDIEVSMSYNNLAFTIPVLKYYDIAVIMK